MMNPFRLAVQKSPHDDVVGQPPHLNIVLLQKTMDQGVDYCKRKVNLIAENLNKIAKVRKLMWVPDCPCKSSVAVPH